MNGLVYAWMMHTPSQVSAAGFSASLSRSGSTRLVIPVVPAQAVWRDEVVALCRRDDSTQARVLALVLRDPGLCWQVLATAQEGQRQRGREGTMRDVSHALVSLGMSRVAETLARAPVLLPSHPLAAELSALLVQARMAGLIARQCATHAMMKNLEEVYLGAMLLMALPLSLMLADSDRWRQLQEAPGPVREKQLWGDTLAGLTQARVAMWPLPAAMREMLTPPIQDPLLLCARLARGDRAAAQGHGPARVLVMLANHVAMQMMQGWHNHRTGRACRMLAGFLGVSTQRAHQIMVTAALDVSRWSPDMPSLAGAPEGGSVSAEAVLNRCSPAPAAGLLSPEHGLPGPERLCALSLPLWVAVQSRERPSSAAVPATGLLNPPPVPRAAPSSRSPKPELVRQAMVLLRDALADIRDAQVLFNLLIMTVHYGLAVQRAEMWLLNGDRSRLVRYAAAGDGLAEKSLSLDAAGQHLFRTVLTGKVLFWLNADNRVRYEALLPAEWKQSYQARECVAMPLSNTTGKPVGLVYVDNGDQAIERDTVAAINRLLMMGQRALLGLRKKT